MDQLGAEERKKIFEMMKDRELGGNMDWMYRGDKADTEEYLLGKPVDKLVTGEPSAHDDGGINSLFSERIKANVALDMQAKMREDPLFAIRRKEEEARRRLLENPVKMKQLQKLLEQQQKAKLKREKKEKKKKKNKKRSKSSENDSSDSEDDLMNKYLSILTQKQKSGVLEKGDRQRFIDDVPGKGNREERLKHKESDRSDGFSRHTDVQHKWKHYEHKPHQRDSPERDRRMRQNSDGDHRETKRRSSSPHQDTRKHKGRMEKSDDGWQHAARGGSSDSDDLSQRVYGLIKSIRHQSSETTSVSRAKSSKTHRSSSSDGSGSRSRSPVRGSHKHHSPDPPRVSNSDKYRSAHHCKSPSPVSRQKHSTANRRRTSPPRRKITAEEREKKLQEMMENAKWREEQRTKNIQQYQEDDAKDASDAQKEGNFLNSMMSEHFSKSSVEDRLKRNKYNIQRTKAALEKNFTQH